MLPLISDSIFTKKRELEWRESIRQKNEQETSKKKHSELDATNWLKKQLEDTIAGDDELIIRTELKGGMGKYGRLLGWLYVGDDNVSLNEQMIGEGYAWAYDGGTKNKDFEELRELRRSRGTLNEG